MRREAFKFCDLLRLILETLRYVLRCIKKWCVRAVVITEMVNIPRCMQCRVLGETRIYHIYIAQIDLRFTLLKCRSYSMTMVPQKGSARCFSRPYVPQHLCSPLYDISPYVSHVPQSLCYPEMFPSPVVHRIYILITQSLCSPVPMFPIFPSTHDSHIPQSLYSPVPIFPSAYVPQTCPHVPPTSLPVPMLPSPIPQKYFPFLMSPKHVPQSLCLYFE